MMGRPSGLSCINSGPNDGPSTYLHAGASKVGWPHDHKAEDTFECPDISERTAQDAFLARSLTEASLVTREYTAEFDPKGRALLLVTTISKYTTAREIASFDTMADAQKAAQALNEHEGY